MKKYQHYIDVQGEVLPIPNLLLKRRGDWEDHMISVTGKLLDDLPRSLISNSLLPKILEVESSQTQK